MERVSILDSSYQQCKWVILLTALLISSVESYSQKKERPIYHYTGVSSLPLKSPSPEELLTYYLNHGHPYASITLANVSDSLNTEWEVNPGAYVVLDTIQCSLPLIHYKTLCRLTHLQPGTEFNQKTVLRLQERIKRIPGINACAAPSIELVDQHYKTSLCFSKSKSNRIEALVGINNNALTGKTNLTGNLDIKLENLAHLAETFELNWKRPFPNSQSLNAKLSSPFTFGLPVGFAAQFQSFLKDSTFATGNFNFQILTGATSNEGLVVYLQRNSATAFHSNAAYGNTKAKLYGAKQSIQSQVGLYRLAFTGDIAYGSRILEENANSTSKPITKLNLVFSCVTDWRSRYFISLTSTFYQIKSDSLFTNELARLGGTQSLRGFMDESIYTSSYTIHSMNAGLKLGPDFQLYALFDYATLFLPYRKNLYNPGLGIKLLQGNSAVNLTYAIGNIDGNNLQFRNGRIGVSLVSSF